MSAAPVLTAEEAPQAWPRPDVLAIAVNAVKSLYDSAGPPGARNALDVVWSSHPRSGFTFAHFIATASVWPPGLYAVEEKGLKP